MRRSGVYISPIVLKQFRDVDYFLDYCHAKLRLGKKRKAWPGTVGVSYKALKQPDMMRGQKRPVCENPIKETRCIAARVIQAFSW